MASSKIERSAARHPVSAEAAWPRCRWPVGLGAKRVTIKGGKAAFRVVPGFARLVLMVLLCASVALWFNLLAGHSLR